MGAESEVALKGKPGSNQDSLRCAGKVWVVFDMLPIWMGLFVCENKKLGASSCLEL